MNRYVKAALMATLVSVGGMILMVVFCKIIGIGFRWEIVLVVGIVAFYQSFKFKDKNHS